MLGIGKERLALVQLPAFDGHQLVAQIMKFSAEVKQIPAPKRTGKVADTALKKGR
jgi:coenzyme F420-reducing hydrogenase delta subunit